MKQTSMLPVGFESAIPLSERAKTYALDSVATGIGCNITPGATIFFTFLNINCPNTEHASEGPNKF
jgi:hypothetical protein